MKRVAFVLVFLCVFYFAHASVIEADGSNFDALIAKHSFAFVAYTAPWYVICALYGISSWLIDACCLGVLIASS